MTETKTAIYIMIDMLMLLQILSPKFVTVIIGFILLVVNILYLIDWAVVLQFTGIEGYRE